MKASDTFDYTLDNAVKAEFVNVIYIQMMEVTREIRHTVENLSVWGCALFLFADSLLVSGQVPSNLKNRILLSVLFIVFSIVLLRVIFALMTRYRVAAHSIRRLNEAQRVHDVGVYLHDDKLAPNEWAAFGTPAWKEPIFQAAFFAIPVTTVTSLVVTWVV
jgi:hypothetical protein